MMDTTCAMTKEILTWRRRTNRNCPVGSQLVACERRYLQMFYIEHRRVVVGSRLEICGAMIAQQKFGRNWIDNK